MTDNKLIKQERAEYLAKKLKIPYDEALILVENMEAQVNE